MIPSSRNVACALRRPGSALLAGLAVAACGPSAGPGLPPFPSAAGGPWVEMEVATVGMDLANGAPLALLHQGWTRLLPVWIGDAEARSIAQGRAGSEGSRPGTHDLFSTVLTGLEAVVVEVRVHDLRDGVYLGAVRLRTREGLREFDARPSDALALAVRSGAPVLVSEPLLDEDPEVEFLSSDEGRALARLRGVTVAPPTEDERAAFGIPAEVEGLLVLHAPPRSGPGGVRRGDLLLEVGGRPVVTATDFLIALSGRGQEARVSARLLREGVELERDIEPRRPPPQAI